MRRPSWTLAWFLGLCAVISAHSPVLTTSVDSWRLLGTVCPDCARLSPHIVPRSRRPLRRSQATRDVTCLQDLITLRPLSLHPSKSSFCEASWSPTPSMHNSSGLLGLSNASTRSSALPRFSCMPRSSSLSTPTWGPILKSLWHCDHCKALLSIQTVDASSQPANTLGRNTSASVITL
ncbi:hypothetical protein BD309DRAFT_975599 [Dichomitus squalens]|nr:hypothetical protein BD309DRAFT_975599 [Dichomitus squalens]